MPLEPTTRRSATNRVLLGAYLCALIYGSLYPWTGWQSLGGSSLSFLTESWPRYWTWFDLIANLLLYLPLGILAQFSLRPRRSIFVDILSCTLAASLLSMGIEAAQGYMPGRVPSLTDWLANTAGALLGSLLGAGLPRFTGLDARQIGLHHWRRNSAAGPALLLAWVLMQINPQRLLFGSGELTGLVTGLWRSLFDEPGSDHAGKSFIPESILDSLRLAADYAVMVEAAGTAFAILAIGMVVREVFLRHAPRVLITALLLLSALAVRALSAGALYGADQAFTWLTAGAQGGLLTGVLLVAILASANRRARLLIGICALTANIVLTCGFPVDAYYESLAGRWDHREWRNLTALLRTVSIAWPFAAIGWCLFRLRPARRDLGSIIRGQ